MKKVAIDASPTKSGHSARGIGSYTRQLLNQFKKGKWPTEFEFFTDPATPPPADLVHYPYFDLFFHTLPGKKSVARGVTIHDVIPLVFPRYFPAGIRGYINLFFQKRALANTDFIICDSGASKKDIIDKLQISDEKIYVICLAAGENFKKLENKALLENVRKKFHLPKEFALYVGDVNWNKNVEGLLTAIFKVRIPAVLVGQAITDQNLEPVGKINKLIARLNLEDKITKTGFVAEDDLIALYNLAALTVLPSFYEGFGLPVLESMACGTPVVCSNAGSLSEIAGPAIICDPADPADIASKIGQVLNLTKPKRDQVVRKSQDHSAKFTWQKTAQQTVNIYMKYMK